MRINKQIVFSSGLPAFIGWTLIAGCSTKNDAISQAEKTEMDRPDVAEECLISNEASYDFVQDLDWLKPASTAVPIAPPKIAMPSKENTQRNTEFMNNPAVETRYLLFENQGALDDEDIMQYAATPGLDVSRMIRKILAGRHTARAREDFRSGARGGVNGRPTLFINGVRYEGSPDSPLAAIVELDS